MKTYLRAPGFAFIVCSFAPYSHAQCLHCPPVLAARVTCNSGLPYTVGGSPRSIAVGDIGQSDGRLDFVTANLATNNISKREGNAGCFTGPGTYALPAGSAPNGMALGDFDRNGVLDLVAADFTNNRILFLRGDSVLTFLAATTWPTQASGGPLAVAAADFNKDGKLDVVVTNFSSTTVSLLLGDGTGGFMAPIPFTVGTTPLSIAVGDLDCDGWPDLAVGNQTNGGVSILLNTRNPSNPNSQFLPRVAYTWGIGPVPNGLVVRDFNNDSKPDIAVANQNGTPASVSIMLGNGNGTFPTVSLTYPTGGLTPTGIDAGDLNGDGVVDLVVTNYNSNTISILLGNGCPGNGTFQTAITYPVGANPISVAVRDGCGQICGQGCAADSGPGVPPGRMVGTRTGGTPVPLSIMPTNLATPFRDFDCDGKLDVAVANNGSNNVSVLWNATIIFPAPVITAEPTGSTALTGSNVAFTVAASGTGPFSYQWRRNCVPLADGGRISGSHTAALIYGSVTLADDRSCFDCIVTNACGSTQTCCACLCVRPSCTGDFNADGTVTSADFFDFISAFFTGCP